jgi:hypothetical protein
VSIKILERETPLDAKPVSGTTGLKREALTRERRAVG